MRPANSSRSWGATRGAAAGGGRQVRRRPDRAQKPREAVRSRRDECRTEKLPLQTNRPPRSPTPTRDRGPGPAPGSRQAACRGFVDLAERRTAVVFAEGFEPVELQGRNRLVDQVLDRGQRLALIG